MHLSGAVSPLRSRYAYSVITGVVKLKLRSRGGYIVTTSRRIDQICSLAIPDRDLPIYPTTLHA